VTIEKQLGTLLKAFVGASNHPENRHKIKIIIRQFLPDVTEEDMDTAITGILSVPSLSGPKGPNDSH